MNIILRGGLWVLKYCVKKDERDVNVRRKNRPANGHANFVVDARTGHAIDKSGINDMKLET